MIGDLSEAVLRDARDTLASIGNETFPVKALGLVLKEGLVEIIDDVGDTFETVDSAMVVFQVLWNKHRELVATSTGKCFEDMTP